ncbi:hypothetical protein J1N09_05335 [Aureitalea sp. L0-47]|uniref:FISUMP domain-containing protein n=1 Tax=Aureitalea sp. L0-47 TaxID=2816962 RepID=UPI0022379E38|nr:FISUMP domain-containing protein [Aureitalea sp. L0-47]MCW5519251.1 hypothetical protein [Aureitalea sp. L0-47]
MQHFHLIRPIISKFLLLVIILFSSCQKDDSAEQLNEPDPAQVDGRFSVAISCSVISPPAEVNLNSYYKKYINCNGIPVIGSEDVPDEALEIASETINFLLTNLTQVRNKLILDGNYVALYPEGGSLASLPENFPISGSASTGSYTYGPDLRAAASDVTSLLCKPEGGVGHTLVHEMGHMIHLGGFRQLDGSFQSQLNNAYNNARSNGLWDNTYAATNANEYLAEAYTIWYGVNWIGPEGGDGVRNDIGTRLELQGYDAGIHGLLNANVNSLTNIPGCRLPVQSGASANCPSTISDIDGNVYEVVNIGPMCWMKENLRTTRYRNGNPIPNIQDGGQWQNTSIGAWAHFDNDSGNDAVYGKLYNGIALVNPAGLCPEGWHVPSIQELQDLVNYAGGDHKSFNLRSTQNWGDNPPIPGTNTSGFNLFAGGIRTADGGFNGLGSRSNLGSVTAVSDANNYSKAIFDNHEFVFTDNIPKNTGYTCRCIKD